ncbi:MAG: FAD-binding protein [Bacteroidales bacterium]|nr:FAD-binding protein [Bacteroidales bacterium]
MIQKVTIIISPADAKNDNKIINYLAQQLKINSKRIVFIQLIKRSIDARNAQVKLQLTYLVHIDKFEVIKENEAFIPQKLKKDKSVIIIGSGPAGLFAALRLIMLGIKPIVFEQGNDVHQRKRDIAQMYRINEVNEQSNYCFGEGGAGTFSDGKLYTRSSKRGDIEWFLKLLIQAGASTNIAIDAHPHIGSDKLPAIVENLRKWIIQSGGEVHFASKVNRLIVNNGICKGVEVNGDETIYANAVILATGHSSHDVYKMLDELGVELLPKGFALGVRIEHPQKLINTIQYHDEKYIKYLPAAEYKVVEQVNERGVYSFCMCPGGMVVPASTQKGLTVVNGMSASHRGSPFANSGFVVEIRPEDIAKQATAADMLAFQLAIEKKAYQMVENGLKAPAQRIVDFMQGRVSDHLPTTSYIPGLVSSPMHQWLPIFIVERLKGAFKKLQYRMKGFIDAEAIMIGVESRTSSPVRIPRNLDTYEQLQIKGLYPCGEGAGYAGGITSSAFDGVAVAEVIAQKW